MWWIFAGTPRSEFRFHGLLWGPSEAFDGKSLVRDSETTKLAYQLHPDSMSGGPPITETPRQILRNGLRVTGAELGGQLVLLTN